MSLFLSYGNFRIKEKVSNSCENQNKSILYLTFNKATEFDVKSILEASADLVLNNNMANLIGLNLNLKKFKSTVADEIFNILDDVAALAAVGFFSGEKSIELAGKVSNNAATIYMDTVAWITESGTSLTINDTQEAVFLSAFGESTRRALWPVVTLTFCVNVAVSEGARTSGTDTEKIFENMDQLLKIFEGKLSEFENLIR
jgi:hypothetical protein